MRGFNMRFLASELREMLVSILVLAVAVSGLDSERMLLVSLPLVVGFFLHEISHKWVASRHGFFSVYRWWPFGLLLALVLGLASRGRMIFAAPGAVVILAGFFTPRQSGEIALAGPLTNLLLSAAFFLLPFGGWVGEMCRIGARLNLWLAVFNLLPLPPLDGFKVFTWKPTVWALVALPSLALSFFFS
jgi:Zn-dependent protease